MHAQSVFHREWVELEAFRDLLRDVKGRESDDVDPKYPDVRLRNRCEAFQFLDSIDVITNYPNFRFARAFWGFQVAWW